MSCPFMGGGLVTGTSAVQRPGELGAQGRDLGDGGAYDGEPVVDDVSLQVGHVRAVGVKAVDLGQSTLEIQLSQLLEDVVGCGGFGNEHAPTLAWQTRRRV